MAGSFSHPQTLQLGSTIWKTPAIRLLLFSEHCFQSFMRIHGGIVFPETASLFMHCLKWIAQLSRDKKCSARGSHFLVNRQENELSREQRPWWCPQGILIMVIFTVFLEADLASFPFLMCGHSCPPGSFYPRPRIRANDCPLVMLSRLPETHFHTLQHSSSCWGNWIWAGL